MESDSFFYQLFNQLPQTLFELLGLPGARAKSYRFDSVELKKAFRVDGLFLPNRRTLPLYFVEVQFQRLQKFYANLFAKVFCYLEENDPKQEWVAVAIFPSRNEEPKHLGPYDDLLRSTRVKRIFLEDVTKAKNPPVGLGILQLLFASVKEAEVLAPRIVSNFKGEIADSESQTKVVELVERLLMTRFTGMGLEEIRMKFKLHDIRKSKAFQELCEEFRKEGIEKGREEGKIENRRELIQKWVAKGLTEKQIADLLDIGVAYVRRLANGHSH